MNLKKNIMVAISAALALAYSGIKDSEARESAAWCSDPDHKMTKTGVKITKKSRRI